MSSQRVGILGGSFDPIHSGHLDLADAAVRVLALPRVFVIPSNVPPHRPQPVASAYHRFAMAAIAVTCRPGWRVVDLELRAATPSYTSSTLEYLHNRGYSAHDLFFIIGADAFSEIAEWHDYPRILDAAHFAVVSRRGQAAHTLRQRLPDLASRMVDASDSLALSRPSIILIDAETADVSSTAIRNRLSEAASIEGMVPAHVQQHIEQHGLYLPETPGRRLSDGTYLNAVSRLHGKD
jgi:nicotinate-nucleotide adenylyltransferase